MITKDELMEMRVALLRRGIKAAHIAREMGLSRSTVTTALTGVRPNRRVVAYVRDVIGFPPVDLPKQKPGRKTA